MKKTASNLPALLTPALADMMQLSTKLANSKIVPTCYQGKPDEVFAALQYAKDLSVGPMVLLSNSFPVNNKLGFYTEFLHGLAARLKSYGGFEIIELTVARAKIRMHRIAGGKLVSNVYEFSADDAYDAGLANKDMYKKWPKRMYMSRCLGFALRDMFPEATKGMHSIDELTEGEMAYIPGDAPQEDLETIVRKAKNVTPKKPAKKPARSIK